MLELALERGHEVSLVHRGNTPLAESLKSQVTEYLCDRNDLDPSLGETTWDAVIDTSAYYPKQALASAKLLQGKVGRYCYISTISVYPSEDNVRDDSVTLPRPAVDYDIDTFSAETYGPLKLECEFIIQEHFGDKTTIVRPTIVVGERDYTDRFTYWVLRLAGLTGPHQVLVPSEGTGLVQWIYDADLARFTLDRTEANEKGTFNCAAPASSCTFSEMIQLVHSALESKTELIPISKETLLQNDVKPWADLPLWIPDQDMASVKDKSIQHGLTYTDLGEVARRIANHRSEIGDFSLKTGLSHSAEAELLRRFTSA